MSTLSPQLMTGFISEAQGYVDSLRDLLATSPAAPGQEALEEIARQIGILASAAEMLKLDEMAALAASAEEMLAPLLGNSAAFSEEDAHKLVDILDQIDARLARRSPENAGSQNATLQNEAVVVPDMPPELREIFTQEAAEHIQAIQEGLESARRQPDDKEALNEIRRVTHTLKGAAASVGFTSMARLAHLMEDLLERYLEVGHRLTPTVIDLLADTTDALGGFMEPDRAGDLTALLRTISRRYAQLLGEDYSAPLAGESSPPSGENTLSTPTRRAENILRLPLADIDQLINRVGEIVINRGGLEGHLGTLNILLAELNHSTGRLRRLTRNIDEQIEAASIVSGKGISVEDPAFDVLELDRYSLLHQFTRELEEVASDTGDVNSRLHLLAGDMEGALTRERRLTTELQSGLIATRLVPFREIETRLRRVVHRAATDLGKPTELVLTGFDTEVDKTVLDTLADPLMHLLRNAIDHGLEAPAVRAACNKPATGLVKLDVSRERSRISLRLSDDGAGVDVDQVRQRAIDMGIIQPGDSRSADQLLDLLFIENFSLAQTVTQTSGRGIGLDIVRRAVNQLQGMVRLETSRGQGTTVLISVPITLSIVRALFARIFGRVYAIPLDHVSAVLRLQPEDLEEVSRQGVLHYQGRPVAIHSLANLVQRSDATSPDQHYGLLIETENQATVVLVDGLAGIRETVIKSLGSHLRRIHGVSGGTISGDGQVVLILDLPELIAGERPALNNDNGERRKPLPPQTASSYHVLVVDDSLSVRRVICSFLERMGWQATAARDGIDALEKLSTSRPDVALVDIEMPRMNGYELLSRIKSDPAFLNLPVVFLTSRSAAKHRERATQLNVDGYLVKPYQENELIAELRRVIQVKHV